MANIPTVCLGRNIRFNFAIQSYAQLYGEDWMTIDGNYGNIPYLLTTNESKTESIDGWRLLIETKVIGLK